MNQQAKILVVDDEPINRKLIEALLRPLGHQVWLATNGQECLEQVPRVMPDLILLDVMMPQIDGYEVARRLKTDDSFRHIPIVIVTALNDVNDRVRALEVGADDFLTKPVDKSELHARVRSLLKVKAYNDHMLNHQRELEAAVAARTDELANALNLVRRSSLDTIFRLSRAAEYRDEDTGSHITRMSNYSALLARRLGLGKKTAQAILYAAPMHDVGKIGIPDHILLKPGKLNPDEWEIMKSHTTIGAGILSHANSSFLRLGEVVALTHHEKWDGSGYPRGLKGKKIPLVGRIVAIADVFDALVSRRPYKEPFTTDKALSIIKEGRGNHFDPMVVDAFLGVYDGILEIHEKYKDDALSHLYRLARDVYLQQA